MPQRLDATAADFSARFDALLAMKREVSEDVDAAARAIIADVVARGDAALVDLSLKFDRIDLEGNSLAITRDEIAAATAACQQAALDALDLAHRRIVAFHERQKPQDLRFTDEAGVE